MKTIKVSNMNCMNCVKKIQGALLKDDINAEIDLKNHTVEVTDKDLEKAVSNIKEVGYNTEV